MSLPDKISLGGPGFFEWLARHASQADVAALRLGAQGISLETSESVAAARGGIMGREREPTDGYAQIIALAADETAIDTRAPIKAFVGTCWRAVTHVIWTPAVHIFQEWPATVFRAAISPNTALTATSKMEPGRMFRVVDMRWGTGPGMDLELELDRKIEFL